MKKMIAMTLALILCLSLCACGQKTAENTNTVVVQTPQVIYPDTTGEKIDMGDLLLAEDENVKITLVDFYVENRNLMSGPSEEKCATLKIENKTQQELVFNARAYLDNEELTVIGMSSNSVEAGRVARYAATYDYGVYPNSTPVESLDKLYGLEWSIELMFGAGTNDRNQYDVQCSIAEAMNGGPAAPETEAPQASPNQAYAAVIPMMTGNVWFFNGGSDAALNKLEFTEDAAVITQIVYDGNGAHNNGSSSLPYLMSGTDVTLTLADGTALPIPYSIDSGSFTLEDSSYRTPAEVDADLQGYWGLRESDNSMGLNMENEYIYFYNNGKVTYEKASKALDGADGDYYYYGPYDGTYTIDSNGLTSTAKNSWQFGFNIIDGKAVMVRCGSVCSPVSGFKGQNGYSF